MGAMKELAWQLHTTRKCDRKTCVFCESARKVRWRF